MWKKTLKGLYFYENLDKNIKKNNLKKNNLKIAAFNLHGTLIEYNFQKNIILPNRIEKLKELKEKGFSIVIITNLFCFNHKIRKNRKKLIKEFVSFLSYHNLDDVLIASSFENGYKKPNDGMIHLLDKYKINNLDSFYCGNLAGRQNDLSNIDLIFSKNIGFKFFLPEEIFN